MWGYVVMKLDNENFKIYLQKVDKDVSQYSSNIRLLYCINGFLKVKLDDNVYQLKKGEILAVNVGQYYELQAIEKMGYVCNVDLDSTLFEQRIKTNMFFIRIDQTDTDSTSFNNLKDCLDELIYYDLQVEGKNDFFKLSIFLKIMDVLGKNYLYKLEEENGYSNNDIRSQEIRLFLQENYMNRISLTDLANHLYISEGYLSRFFKKKMGIGFLTYLNDIRLYHTVDELINTDKAITDIAMKNGFNSISGFNQLFKKKYQLSPREYRNSFKNISSDVENIVKSKAISYLNERKDKNTKITKKYRDIVADSTKHKKYSNNWSSIINIGDAGSLLEERMQQVAKLMHTSLGYKYLRIWNFFETVNIDDEHHEINFDKLDTIIDFILQNGMKPFIVLGAKPYILTFEVYGRRINSLTKNEQLSMNRKYWQKVLSLWLKHISFRYGNEEIASWFIELWKPNKWDSVYTDDYLDSWYITWLKDTINLVKEKIPSASIGGCEFVFSDDVTNRTEMIKIVKVWEELDFSPDFISIADYPYISNNQGKNNSKLSAKNNQIAYYVNEAKQFFDDKYPHAKLYVTEWNLTIANRDILNDTPFKGAYVIQNLTENLRDASQTTYWFASDIYAEYSDSTEILYGASGLVTKQGIKKPVYYAFAFLNELYSEVIYQDDNCIITTDTYGNYMILFNSAKPFTNLYYENQLTTSKMDYNKVFLDLEEVEFALELSNVTNGNYELRSKTVDKENGNLLEVWHQLNFTKRLKLEDIQYLTNLSQPRLSVSELKVTNQKISLKEKLAANSFKLLSIRKIN